MSITTVVHELYGTPTPPTLGKFLGTFSTVELAQECAADKNLDNYDIIAVPAIKVGNNVYLLKSIVPVDLDLKKQADAKAEVLAVIATLTPYQRKVLKL